MKPKIIYTKKDVIITLCCVAFLLMNLGVAGRGSRKRAQEMVCLSNLRQWTDIFNTHIENNNGYFSDSNLGSGPEWLEVLSPYYDDHNLLLCPEAARPMSLGASNPFAAWGILTDGSYGSYGINEYAENRSSYFNEDDNYWGYLLGISDTNQIPLLLDCFWYDVWPHLTDLPPVTDGSTLGLAGNNEMRRVCLNRHNGAVNCLFLDFSARKVGLKELWTLKWHRNYDTAGPWTKAGGALWYDWPQWMKNFKDY